MRAEKTHRLTGFLRRRLATLRLAVKLSRIEPGIHCTRTTRPLSHLILQQVRVYRVLVIAIVWVGLTVWTGFKHTFYNEIRSLVPEYSIKRTAHHLETLRDRMPLELCFHSRVLTRYREIPVGIITETDVVPWSLRGIDVHEERLSTGLMDYCDTNACQKLQSNSPYLLIGRALAERTGLRTGKRVHLIDFSYLENCPLALSDFSQIPIASVECYVLPATHEVFDEWFMAISAEHFDHFFQSREAQSTWSYQSENDPEQIDWQFLKEGARHGQFEIKSWREVFPELIEDAMLFERTIELCLMLLMLFSLLGLCAQISVTMQEKMPMFHLLLTLGAGRRFCILIGFLGLMLELLGTFTVGIGLGCLSIPFVRITANWLLQKYTFTASNHPISAEHFFQFQISGKNLMLFFASHLLIFILISGGTAYLLTHAWFKQTKRSG